MTPFAKLTIITTLGVSICAFAFSSSWAAQPGTYRPGSPYQSLPLDDARQCEFQCKTDSSCRGWNFVKVSPRQSSGVCEFNSQAAAPIASPVSISGNGAFRNNSSRLVSTGTRTVRVGSPETKPTRSAPNHASVNRTPNLASQPSYSRPSNRNGVRAPIPKRTTPNQAYYTQPKRQAYTQTRPVAPARLQHSLDDAPAQATQRRLPAPAAIPGQIMPTRPVQQARSNPSYPVQNHPRATELRLQHTLEAIPQQSHPMPTYPSSTFAGPQKPVRTDQTTATSPARSQPYPAAKPNAHSVNQAQTTNPQVTPQASLETRPARNPKTMDIHATQRIKSQTATGGPLVGLNAKAAQTSLFGSLYDDVKQPKPITASEIADPEAPIATVTSVPTQAAANGR